MVSATSLSAQGSPMVTYGKYEFVPGDSVVFTDDLTLEKVGEFPSRWKLGRGNAEVAKLGDAPVIAFMAATNSIDPQLPAKVLPVDAFTVEFDVYFHQDGSNEAYMVNFGPAGELDIRTNQLRIGNFKGPIPGGEVKAGWHRVAVGVKGRAMKVYLDQSRVLNIPELPGAPASVQFRALGHSSAKGNPASIRDVRIAIGSTDLYERLVKEGKFVTRGIQFDVNKAEVRPTSMGVLNQVALLMREHPTLTLSVEGHTDSDGDAAANQTLSEQRATAVVDQLVAMGVPAQRLSARGLGESMPMSANSSAESRSNNRRVEFVKGP
jgi:outer membrane protein OmpA-like peptidoglycan-associated protein